MVLNKPPHICAAYPNGARYNTTMTNDERRNQSNLMLFCNPHHDVVDSKDHEKTYTVERLQRWKAQREADPRQALQRLREVTPAGLRRIVAEGMEQRDAKMLGALQRLEGRDREAAILIRNLMDELTEAYSLQRRTLDPDVVEDFGLAVRSLHDMRDTLEDFSLAAEQFQRLRRGGYEWE
jgi:hypothetical protein